MSLIDESLRYSNSLNTARRGVFAAGGTETGRPAVGNVQWAALATHHRVRCGPPLQRTPTQHWSLWLWFRQTVALRFTFVLLA